MPFVKRDDSGAVIAISRNREPGYEEEMALGDAELAAFVFSEGEGAKLEATDQDFVRVLEDVVQLLIDKGLILFTELPQSAQEKILRRQQLRTQLTERLDLLGDD